IERASPWQAAVALRQEHRHAHKQPEGQAGTKRQSRCDDPEPARCRLLADSGNLKMRSLLVRIFVSFWLIIGITIGVAAIAGYYYAERVRSEMEGFEFDDAVLDASAA